MEPAEPRNSRSRRWFLRAAALFGGSLAALKSASAAAADLPNRLGAPVSEYGNRSRFVRAVRAFGTPITPQATSSRTPLRDSQGIITASSLHYERHHSGVPDLDPATHTLTVHGLVNRQLVFTLEELKRFPSVSRIFFLECSGNTSSEWRGANVRDVQGTHGLTSCSEWTGVWLSTILRECGLTPAATWILAEGADAARVARSIPIAKAMKDVLVAYAQNGEPLRPEQGYPLRLVVPGCEGITSIKWLHRLKAIDQPAMTRWETSKYTDLLTDGTSRMFTLDMDAKSIITRPSGGETLPGRGVYEISGLAWSGRGSIARVEITTDGGLTWSAAELQTPVLPLAHTRFRASWNWDGRDALIASRAIDETGYLQPTLSDLVRLRGTNTGYHNNAIIPWKVSSTGAVTNGLS
jgi:sulfane dehydrogenase subunit SoxC